MADITINTVVLDDCTIGALQCGKFRCFTLELPWINNANSISCIPSGTYDYVVHQSPSLGKVIHILDVEKRKWIYIHKGNFKRQIKGCILVGTMLKDIDGDGSPDVGSSGTAFNNLMNAISLNGGTITINGKGRT